MRKLDQRGAAALEFCIVAMTIFALIFGTFDLGRYAITMQSLRSLAGLGARAAMIDDCYMNAVLKITTTPTCSGDYTTDAQKRALVPYLYANSGSPTVTTVTDTASSTITVTASASFTTSFRSIWGSTFDSPSATVKIPF
jgi:Flp pilus assembly protein TadG